MKKLLLLFVLSFLFAQNSNAQCDPVLTINENFGWGLPACWTQPNGNTAIDNNNGIFWGHPTYGAIILLREVANLTGTLVLQVRTHTNQNSSFHVERIQNGVLVSQQIIHTTPNWQNATLNFTGFPGRGYIRIRQYTANAPGIRLTNVSYNSSCPVVQEVIFKTNDLTVPLDGSGNATITPEQVDIGSITTCGVAITNFSLDVSTFTCAELGSNTVTLSAEDGSGNVIGTTTVIITVEDTQAPTVIGQNIAVQADGDGSATITTAMVDNGSFDGCGTVTLSLSKSTFVCGETGDFTVTLTAEDLSGNTASTEVTVTVTSSTINNQVLSATNSDFCPDGSTTFPAATISTASSQVGYDYVLRKSLDNSIIDGPTAGTGSALNFNTGGLTETTLFNVFAEDAGSVTNSALDFDGVDDYMHMSTNASFDYENGYTFETWVKVALPVNDNRPIFSIGFSSHSDIEIYIQNTTNQLIIAHDRNGIGAALGYAVYAAPPNNQWFHLAVTYNGSNVVKVYIDGVAQNTSTDTFSTPLTKTAGLLMKVGRIEHAAFPSGGANFQGQMDELRLWTGARTAGEILADKDNCLIGSEVGLEYYFNLDDNSGLIAIDLVNGTDGTLANMDANSAWDASGTGFSCPKYLNACGFQMLTEIKIGDETPPTAVAQNITVQIDGNTGLATITTAMLDNGSSDNCGGVVTLSLSKTEFGCGDVGANVVALIVVDAAGNQSIANATVTVTSSINNETVTITDTNVCTAGETTTVSTSSSVNGVDYYLRDNSDNTIIDGPITGTGSGLTFNSGNLTATTTFNVYGELASSVGNALDFDGVDDYISTSVPANFNYNTAYTMETWVKAPLPGAAGYPSPLFVGNSTGSDIEVYVQQGTNDLFVVHNRGNGGTLSYGQFPDPPNNVWYHLAIVYNGTIIEVYYDGVSQGSFAILAPVASAGAIINIGYISSGAFNTPNKFKGQLDDYRLWSTTKSSTDINANKGNCLVGDEAGLETYYNFDEGSGLIATDLANANNGTLTNMDAATIWTTDVAITCGQICGFEMNNTVTVTVGDAIDPTVVVQNVTVQINSDGSATITTADINNNSTDNCTANGSLILSLDKTVFTCADLGANTVALTVEDASGNTATATATVMVEDIIAPSPTAQNISIQLNASGNASITAADIHLGSTDNCTPSANMVLSLSKNTFTCADLGVNTVTLTAEDASGNQGSTTATVTVADAINPTPSAQNITVQLDTSGSVTVAASDVNNGSSDNCTTGANLLFSLSKSIFTCADLGNNNIAFIVEDASGNQFSTGATITVEDNVVPTVITQNITVSLDGNPSVSITPQDINNGSSDACGSLTFSLDITTFTAANVGTNTIILTVTDGTGNVNTGTATVTVTQKQAQTITFNALADKTYGDNSFTISATASSGLAVSYAVISGPATLSSNSVSITGAGNVVIEVTQAGDATYAAATAVQQSFNVNKIALTVTAENKFIVYTNAIPPLTFNYLGFINSEGVAVLTTEPTAATTATAGSDAGTYPITLSGGLAANYSFTFVAGSLTINKADQTLSIDAIADQDFTTVTQVTVTSSSSASLATNLSVTGPATISGNIITLDGTAGTITVTATQAGNINYNPAVGVSTTFDAFDGNDPCIGFSVSLVSLTNNSCNGEATGSIDVSVTGGDGNYSYSWSNGANTEDLTSIAADTYTLTVTDGNNCSVTLTETLTETTLIEITATTTDVVAGNDGAADITVTGGTGAYSFSWNNGATTEDLVNVAAGSYMVTVTDANGCSATQTIEVGDIITNVEEIAASTIQVYPNPVSNFLRVEGDFSNGKVEIQIISNLGVQVLTKRFNKLAINILELSLSDLKNGQYMVIINANNKQTVQRININH